ncbi:unnamed protein product [Darwinula stevensoni]|uniref:Septin-type G domain-containing protein n=1 Tax=Darwinula stevensoni TaxID=69355 RepID=A0A7R8XAG7_9CRUS|nr:unnamed protein product [Darwinula stevensoni]CAG0891895.1 unnamed protein product [Darwinula stevensoni]
MLLEAGGRDLAQKMKEAWESEDGYIYQLRPKRTTGDFQCRVQKQEIGNKRPEDGEGKVLMLVGATGAGKSTLVNGIVNYAYRVQYGDDFRLKLINEVENEGTKADSQTEWITAYQIVKQQGIAFPYTLTVIDTPGFGGTQGIKKDHELKDQIQEFFSHGGHFGVDQLHGIGLVVPASEERLTPSLKYVLDSIMSVFGNDVKNNIFLLVTFAGMEKPLVRTAVRAANIPFRKMFQFNNSALFSQDKDNPFNQAFWDMGTQNFQEFFLEFQHTSPVSLTLTKEVLQRRRLVEETLQDTKSKLDAGVSYSALDRLELLREAHAAVRQHGGKLFLRYAKFLPGLNHADLTSSSHDEHVLKKLTKDFNQERETIFQLTEKAHECKRRLNDIAMKPDHFEIAEYINMLIDAEEFDNRPGSTQRIKYLKEAREKAEFAKQAKPV